MDDLKFNQVNKHAVVQMSIHLISLTFSTSNGTCDFSSSRLTVIFRSLQVANCSPHLKTKLLVSEEQETKDRYSQSSLSTIY